MQNKLLLAFLLATGITANAQTTSQENYNWTATGNPVITHKFTADPATLVDGNTLYVFTGEDEKREGGGYHMTHWCVFSTTDMLHWTEYPTPLRVEDFEWAKGRGKAYAGHPIKSPHDGKYYWYISTDGPGIGVAVSDKATGPYKDAIGKQLLTTKDCFASKHGWACIDPAIFIDDDGTPWLFFGNGQCYYVKLKKNMTELDGAVKQIQFPGFVFEEAPWVHKHEGKYYLSYASHFPERTEYAMADNIEGPWTYGGILNEVAGNSNTNHQAIVDFKGESYFVYHNGALPQGSSNSRSMCVDRLYYNKDKSLKRIVMTSEGVVGKQHQPMEKPDKKSAALVLPEVKNPEAYLFAYFEGRGNDQEALRFAVSEDAVNWHALNGNKPILPSAEISNTGGIRDPHILRCAKGKGYNIVATDMFTIKNGWGFNPGIVLLHSDDLVHWTHSAIDFTKTYPEQFANVQWVWAPQTVYDASVDKYLIYFTVKFKNAKEPDNTNPKRSTLDFYCAYANKDFTALEGIPQLMWSPTYGAIDGDIIADEQGMLHFFYKGNVKDNNAHEYKNGIKQAVAASLDGPWLEVEDFIDAYRDSKTGVEGSGVFKLNPKDCKNGQTEYILMYDLYGSGRYEFQRTNDLYTFTEKPESFTKDFFPRHGTILPITKKELELLEKTFGK